MKNYVKNVVKFVLMAIGYLSCSAKHHKIWKCIVQYLNRKNKLIKCLLFEWMVSQCNSNLFSCFSRANNTTIAINDHWLLSVQYKDQIKSLHFNWPGIPCAGAQCGTELFPLTGYHLTKLTNQCIEYEWPNQEQSWNCNLKDIQFICPLQQTEKLQLIFFESLKIHVQFWKKKKNILHYTQPVKIVMPRERCLKRAQSI